MDENYTPDMEKIGQMITKKMETLDLKIPNNVIEAGMENCLIQRKFVLI